MDEAEALRSQMVQEQIENRGVSNPRVIEAMRNVPRHEFCPGHSMAAAYGDHPLPVGHGQTISQPYIVAVMTEALDVCPGDKVLELGTGSGYQAAVLAEVGCRVYTIEVIPELAAEARERLEQLGYRNVQCKQADGINGWPECAPFKAALATCAASEVPQAVVDQLVSGGKLVLPISRHGFSQWLTTITKTEKGTSEHRMMPVRFVPMI